MAWVSPVRGFMNSTTTAARTRYMSQGADDRAQGRSTAGLAHPCCRLRPKSSHNGSPGDAIATIGGFLYINALSFSWQHPDERKIRANGTRSPRSHRHILSLRGTKPTNCPGLPPELGISCPSAARPDQAGDSPRWGVTLLVASRAGDKDMSPGYRRRAFRVRRGVSNREHAGGLGGERGNYRCRVVHGRFLLASAAQARRARSSISRVDWSYCAARSAWPGE
jgi:hypothetical protein